MKITIDNYILDKYNLSVEEFMILYLSANSVSSKDIKESLVSKGLAHRNLVNTAEIVISHNIKEMLSTIIIESDKNVIDKDSEFIELANKLRELYPSGRKEGTTYMWRGTTAEIAKKLKTLVVKYNYSYTEEQVIKATKSYIDSFRGDYTRMRLLKYFILKSERDADGNIDVISDLMTLIENEGQLDIKRAEWETELI